MLDVKLFEMKSFLPMPYEDALAPRLKLAHDKLQKEVPLSEEGLEQALAWLEEQYASL